MLPSFFIFSLPRSGSSWLSVFLTGRDSFCYHEPTADGSVSSWVQIASERPESVVGAVDTGAYLYADVVTDVIPQTKLFVLERAPDEIQRSTLSFGIRDYDAAAQQEKLLALPFPRIHYEKLEELDYLESIWNVIVGPDFDPVRAKQLQEMNIQRDVGRFFSMRPHLVQKMRA